MSVSYLQKDEGEGRIKPSNVIYDCNSTATSSTFPGLSTVGPNTMPRAERTTPTLMELVTEDAENAFFRQVAGPVEIPTPLAHMNIMVSWFALLFFTSSYAPWYQIHVNHASSI